MASKRKPTYQKYLEINEAQLIARFDNTIGKILSKRGISIQKMIDDFHSDNEVIHGFDMETLFNKLENGTQAIDWRAKLASSYYLPILSRMMAYQGINFIVTSAKKNVGYHCVAFKNPECLFVKLDDLFRRVVLPITYHDTAQLALSAYGCRTLREMDRREAAIFGRYLGIPSIQQLTTVRLCEVMSKAMATTYEEAKECAKYINVLRHDLALATVRYVLSTMLPNAEFNDVKIGSKLKNFSDSTLARMTPDILEVTEIEKTKETHVAIGDIAVSNRVNTVINEKKLAYNPCVSQMKQDGYKVFFFSIVFNSDTGAATFTKYSSNSNHYNNVFGKRTNPQLVYTNVQGQMTGLFVKEIDFFKDMRSFTFLGTVSGTATAWEAQEYEIRENDEDIDIDMKMFEENLTIEVPKVQPKAEIVNITKKFANPVHAAVTSEVSRETATLIVNHIDTLIKEDSLPKELFNEPEEETIDAYEKYKARMTTYSHVMYNGDCYPQVSDFVLGDIPCKIIENYDPTFYKGFRAPERLLEFPSTDIYKDQLPMSGVTNRDRVKSFANFTMKSYLENKLSPLVANEKRVLITLPGLMETINVKNIVKIPRKSPVEMLLSMTQPYSGDDDDTVKRRVVMPFTDVTVDKMEELFKNSEHIPFPEEYLKVVKDNEFSMRDQMAAREKVKSFGKIVNAQVLNYTTVVSNITSHSASTITRGFKKGNLFVTSGFANNIVSFIAPGSPATGSTDTIRIFTLAICSKLYYETVIVPDFHIHESFSFTSDGKEYVLYLTKPYSYNAHQFASFRDIRANYLATISALLVNGKKEEIDAIKSYQITYMISSGASRERTCALLSTLRYVYAQSLGLGCHSMKTLEERFPDIIDSKILLYFLRKMLDNLKRAKADANVEEDIDGMKDMFVFRTPLTGILTSNSDLLFAESFPIKFAQEKHKSRFQAIVATLSTIKKWETNNDYVRYFSPEIIVRTVALMRKHYGEATIASAMAVIDQKLLIGEMGTSAILNDPSTSDNYTKTADAILHFTSTHVKGADMTLGEALRQCKASDFYVAPDIKDEKKGEREINLTTLACLIVLKCINAVSRYINNLDPSESISKRGDKKLYDFQSSVKSAQSFLDSFNYGLLKSNDAKKWSTGDNVKSLFYTFAAMFTSYTEVAEIDETWDMLETMKLEECKTDELKMLWGIRKTSGRIVVTKKPGYYREDILDPQMTAQKEKILSRNVAKKIKRARELGKDDNFISNLEENVVITPIEKVFGVPQIRIYQGWPEGFYNDLSSLKHAVGYTIAAIFISEKVKRFYFAVDYHSDDSFEILMANSREAAALMSHACKIAKMTVIIRTNPTKDVYSELKKDQISDLKASDVKKNTAQSKVNQVTKIDEIDF